MGFWAHPEAAHADDPKQHPIYCELENKMNYFSGPVCGAQAEQIWMYWSECTECLKLSRHWEP